jgi:hypothetical protein
MAMSSLGEEYPKEQARCRELLAEYKALGSVGMFGAAHIEQTLREADEAAISGDLPRMLLAYEAMKSVE